MAESASISRHGGIFLSYRRSDSQHVAGRLFDRLADRFEGREVFMDVDSIRPGAEFDKAIDEAISVCDVFLALIGPGWLDVSDEGGERRLDDPDDLVVLEITAALQQDIHVIPVLVDGASPPRRADLPESLKSLARRNAARLNHESFRSDANRLLTAIEMILSEVDSRRTSVQKEVIDDEPEHQESNWLTTLDEAGGRDTGRSQEDPAQAATKPAGDLQRDDPNSPAADLKRSAHPVVTPTDDLTSPRRTHRLGRRTNADGRDQQSSSTTPAIGKEAKPTAPIGALVFAAVGVAFVITIVILAFRLNGPQNTPTVVDTGTPTTPESTSTPTTSPFWDSPGPGTPGDFFDSPTPTTF